MAVWLVADFEALCCQVTTTFDTSCAARIPTAPAINYTACWQLVFIHIRLSVICLALFSCHYQSAPTYPRSTNLFCFLSVGNPKTVLKGGYSGWRGGSSFACL
jgi:hypothetical protein